MKNRTSLLLIFFISALSFNCKSQDKTPSEKETIVSTFYFIRHAEKDRSDKTNRNPELTDAGHARAQKWNEVLKNVKFDAVYSTDYNRTQQTAAPTAKKNNVKVVSYNPRNIDGKAFIDKNEGKTVLVVGHSNTTPAFVNAVIAEKKYDDIDDSNNANLYIVTIINGTTLSSVLQID